MVIAGFLSFFVSTAAWQAAPEKNDFWVGKVIFWNWTVVIAGFLSFFVSTAAWQAAPEKNDFWVGKIFFFGIGQW